MKLSLKTASIVCALSLSTAVLMACNANTNVTQSAKIAPKSLNIELKAGQLFSIVQIKTKDGEDAAKARQKYVQSAFPLAGEFGMKRNGVLTVIDVVAGQFQPQAVSFFSWPDQAAEATFNAQAEWKDIKMLRSQAWDDLRIYSDRLESDLSLSFSPSKTYTMAIAWINPENPDDYTNYIHTIKGAAESVGGRFIYKMHNPNMESHPSKTGAPGQITFVEWDSPEGLTNFTKTKTFKENAKYVRSGITKFELVRLALPAK